MSVVTILKFAGQLLPEQDINKYLLNTSTYIGLSMSILEKDKAPRIAVLRVPLSKLPDQLKGVMNLQEKFKDKDVLIQFGSLPEGYSEADIQPFVLLHNADNKPAVVCFMEGVTNPRDEIKDYLDGKMKELLTAAGMDYVKMYEQMKSNDRLPREMASMHGGDGNITFMFPEGKVLHFGKEGTGVEGDWGWATNSFETTAASEQPVPEQPIVETSPEDDLADALGITEAPAPVAPDAKPAAPPQAPAQSVSNKPKAPSRPTVASTEPLKGPVAHPPGGTKDEGHKWETPPQGMREADLLRWILKRADAPPKNYVELYKKGELKLLIPTKTVVKDLKDLGTTAAKVGPVKVDPPKTKEPPVLTAKERESIVVGFIPTVGAPLVDKDGNGIMDPKVLGGFEEKHPNIAEQLGLANIGATFHWGMEDLDRLTSKHGEAGLQTLKLWSLWLKYNLVLSWREQGKIKKDGPAPAAAAPATSSAPTAPRRAAVPQRRAG